MSSNSFFALKDSLPQGVLETKFRNNVIYGKAARDRDVARPQVEPRTADKPSPKLGEGHHKSTIPVYTMPRVNQRQANEREEQIQEVLRYYAKTKRSSIKNKAHL